MQHGVLLSSQSSRVHQITRERLPIPIATSGGAHARLALWRALGRSRCLPHQPSPQGVGPSDVQYDQIGFAACIGQSASWIHSHTWANLMADTKTPVADRPVGAIREQVVLFYDLLLGPEERRSASPGRCAVEMQSQAPPDILRCSQIARRREPRPEFHTANRHRRPHIMAETGRRHHMWQDRSSLGIPRVRRARTWRMTHARR